MAKIGAAAIFIALLFGTVPLSAQAQDIKARNAARLARTPATEGIFALEDNGDIRHLQSGMKCIAGYPNVEFFAVMIFPSAMGDGMDVGCDYARVDGQNRAVSKLTVFAVKAPAGMTLDQAFDQYNREVLTKAPTAKHVGPVMTMNSVKGSEALPEFRSAEYDVVGNGISYRTDLVVALKAGWIVEIRATFLTGAVATEQDAAARAGDIVAPGVALLTAIQHIAAR